MAIVLALGRSWRTSSKRFGPIEAKKKVTPVTLPPGGPRLGTRPNSTGSPPAVRAHHLWRRSRQPDADQFGSQPRQPIVVAFRPAIHDGDVLALGIPRL